MTVVGVAILMTGIIRLANQVHLDDLLAASAGSTTFVVTYPSFRASALILARGAASIPEASNINATGRGSSTSGALSDKKGNFDDARGRVLIIDRAYLR